MAKEHPEPGPIKTDPRVMVVEDEPRMRDLLTQAVGRWGFDVTAAASAEEALRLAAAGPPPEVVLLDLNLPGMDGLDCFRRLRERHPQVQGIVLTGFGSLEAARQAIHLDVVEFLTKPAPLGEIERAMDRAMRRLAPPPPPVLPPEVTESPEASAEAGGGAGDTPRTLEEVERDHILAALRRNDGNRTATAAELGISRRTLYYKLSEYERQGYAPE